MILYLRVDVDFNLCLTRGVPYLLDLLDSAGARATFFTVMGPDTMFRHTKRLGHKDYHKRLSKFRLTKLARHVALPYLRSRFVGVGVGSACPDILKEIVARGHEVAVHGFNHARWADCIYDMQESEVRPEMGRAFEEFKAVLPDEPLIWGAPNWRCNAAMFKVLDEYGVRYSSDVRGISPFYPRIGKREFSVLQYPITQPAIHELVQCSVERADIANVLWACMNPGYNLMCIHGYYEGVMERGMFKNVLGELVRRGVEIRSLRQDFEKRKDSEISACEIGRISVPGGVGEVSCQSGFETNNYFNKLQ